MIVKIMDVVIGIDPGNSGGIAILNDTGALIEVHDMPLAKYNKKHKVDGAALSVILSQYPNAKVYIEEAGSRTGQGITSTFTFGKGFGLLMGVCEALGIHYELVRPQAWQKQFSLATGTKDKQKKKKQIAERCIQLYPDASLTGPRGGLKDGRSDAILISRYGWLIQQTSTT